MIDWAKIPGLFNKEFESIKKLEKISIESSLSRVCAEDIHSQIDIPQFDRSLVDGYAISEPKSLSKLQWKVMGEIRIGKIDKPIEIHSQQAVYVPTGGIVPKGSFAIVKIEETNIVQENNNKILNIKSLPKIGTNIEKVGTDVKYNQPLIHKGEIVSLQKISLLSACGEKRIKVYSKPKFSVIVTGHEIVIPGHSLKMGQVYDSTSTLLRTLVESFGGVVNNIYHTGESKREIVAKLKLSTGTSDIVITTGGTSVGKADNVTKSVAELGKILFHGINIRPGKPVLFGKVNETPILGFPGFVTSSAIIASLFFPIVFQKLYNMSKSKFNTKSKILYSSKVIKAFKGWYRIVPGYNKNGLFIPTFKTSSAITSYSDSTGYIIIKPEEQDIRENDQITFIPYSTNLN